MKKGFTLVELSIVLVIIGLLIGGILAAQSMISTAKVNAVAMQIGQFDAGVENFKTKYNYLPGDAPSFGGNGDGLITSYGNQIVTFSAEVGSFWYDIDSQQFPGVPDCCKGTQASGSGSTKNVPLSKSGKDGSFFIASSAVAAYGSRTPDSSNIKNYYIILDSTQFQTPDGSGYWEFTDLNTGLQNAAFRTKDMLALDTKIDDGVANTGNVISGNIGYSAPITADPGPGLCSNNSGAYALYNDEYWCTPFIRIGSSVGDLQ